MKFKVRQTREEEQEKVLEFWLEKDDDGDIMLHVYDNYGNGSTLLGIDYTERKLRLCKWVDDDLELSLDEEGRIELCD